MSQVAHICPQLANVGCKCRVHLGCPTLSPAGAPYLPVFGRCGILISTRWGRVPYPFARSWLMWGASTAYISGALPFRPQVPQSARLWQMWDLDFDSLGPGALPFRLLLAKGGVVFSSSIRSEPELPESCADNRSRMCPGDPEGPESRFGPHGVTYARPASRAVFSPNPEGRHWTPILIGIGIVIVAVAAIVIFNRQAKKSVPIPDPYAQKLQVSGVQISRANNFVGATVTYLDCRVTNTGDRTVTGARAELTFRNRLNEVVQKEVVPIRVLHTNKLGGYADAVDLSLAPFSQGRRRASGS